MNDVSDVSDRVIVVGVDSSETARAAAERAATVAAAFKARLHVVSAYGKFESETVQIGSDTMVLSNETDAAYAAEKVVRALQAAHPDLEITFAPAEGRPGEALVTTADALGAELIVVGNKRVQGVAGRVLGSIARDVAARATCDVYVAHTTSRR